MSARGEPVTVWDTSFSRWLCLCGRNIKGRNMIRTFLFFAFGYFSGSILFARVYGTLFNKDIIEKSKDKNPGTANAFMHGGMLCGILTLVGDILKGFLPVFLFLKASGGAVGFGIALVLAAPVLGHNYSVFYRFEGGKGIAVSFGCLLGLLPMALPVLILAVCYITLSVIVRISPHFYRTLAAYSAAAAMDLFLVPEAGIRTGMALIAALIIIKHLASTEEKMKFSISLPAADNLKKIIRKAK